MKVIRKMKLRRKIILALIIITVMPMFVSSYYVINKVKEQNNQEVDLKINETLQGVINELNQLKNDYGKKVTDFARSEKIALPTYILHKYGNYRYLDASNKEELTQSIVDSTLLFNLALNFNVAEVRKLDKDLIVALENQRQIGENLIPGSLRGEISDINKVDFIRHENRFLLQAQAPIIWKEQKVGILLIKKYIDEDYLNTLKKTQGVNIVIINDQKVLVSTLHHSLLPANFYRLNDKSDGVIRNIEIQGESYNFFHKSIEIEGDEATILVGLSTRPSLDRINSIKLILLQTSFYIFIIVFLLILSITKKFSSSFNEMLIATDKLKKGDFEEEININSNDELGVLASNINELANLLENYRGNLNQKQEFEENVYDSIREGMIIIDKQGTIQLINKAIADLLAIKREKYINSIIFELPSFDSLRQDFWEIIEEKGSYIKNDFSLQNNESTILLNLKIYPLKEKGINTCGAVILVEDVTKKIEMEKQLLLNDKLTSIGRFTAGIAHEINNPLGTIANFVETILIDEEDETKRNYLESIRSETNRISSIVKGLLNFSRQSKAEFGIVDLREVVELSLKICQYQKEYDQYEIIREFEEELPYVTGNFNQLQQVFINMILNAFESMETGDTLTISMQSSSDGETVGVSFIDTGSGIESQYLQKIFDPFFTTKEERQGVGLGLSISYGIIKNHGGDIKVESALNKGSIFTVSLPIYLSQ